MDSNCPSLIFPKLTKNVAKFKLFLNYEAEFFAAKIFKFLDFPVPLIKKKNNNNNNDNNNNNKTVECSIKSEKRVSSRT